MGFFLGHVILWSAYGVKPLLHCFIATEPFTFLLGNLCGGGRKKRDLLENVFCYS